MQGLSSWENGAHYQHEDSHHDHYPQDTAMTHQGISGTISVNYKPSYIEEGDPLKDEGKLHYGLKISDIKNDFPNTIKKSPSNQDLAKLRWGSNKRSSGRSKTGLQIQVPNREMLTHLTPGQAFDGRSVIYAYTSSSSGDRSGSSFGAIGDHLTAQSPALLTSKSIPMTQRTPIITSNRPLTSACDSGPSLLQDLVRTSVPDDPYKLLVVGEVGPLRVRVVPRIVAPSELHILPHRRRSLTDLVYPMPKLLSPEPEHTEDSNMPNENIASEDSSKQTEQQTTTDVAGVGPSSIDCTSEIAEAPIWKRKGLPFEFICKQVRGETIDMVSLDADLDPSTFSLPYGSYVYMMKATNASNLRASVAKGIFSAKEGANKVLQQVWETKGSGAKIIFLFSIHYSKKHSGQFRGMAEMSGPYNPDANPQLPTGSPKSLKGIVPIRWLVTKDVPFSDFSDLKYHDKVVTELRHANTIPGDIGRRTIQRFFEAKHATTALLHPREGSPDHSDSFAALNSTGLVFRSTVTQNLAPGMEYHPAPGSWRGARLHPNPGSWRGGRNGRIHCNLNGYSSRNLNPGRYTNNFGRIQRHYPEVTLAQTNGNTSRFPMVGRGGSTVNQY